MVVSIRLIAAADGGGNRIGSGVCPTRSLNSTAMRVNGGVKTSQSAAQKSTTAVRRLERPVERARQGVLSSSD